MSFRSILQRMEELSKQQVAEGTEQDVMEKMDPEKRARLDDLIDQFRDSTDPNDYYDRDYSDPEEVIELIKAEFGDKIASEVAAGADKMHFPRQDHTGGYDPMSWKKPVHRQTKTGKMYKQDSDYLKNTIKARYNNSGKSATEEGVAEGYILKKTKVEKTFTPGDPDEYYTSGGADVTTKDTDYEIINNKTGQVVGTASWTTNDYFGPGALKITMKNGATRWLDIWERERGNPQTAFNRFVKDPKTAKKYKEQGVAEAEFEPSMRVGSTGDFGVKPHMQRGTPVAGKIGKYGKTPSGFADPDADPDADKPAAPAVKRGRGRPRKDADSSGYVPKYEFAKALQNFMVGSVPKGGLPGKATTKHRLKDWMEHIEAKTLVESTLQESGMSEVATMLSDIVENGNIQEIHRLIIAPRTPAEEFAGNVINDYFDMAYAQGETSDEAADKFVMHKLKDQFSSELHELALDASQIALPAVQGGGMQSQPATNKPSAGQQTGAAGQAPTSQPKMGAAIVDFKQQNDPLRAALAQAVKNKQVTVMATEGEEVEEREMTSAEKSKEERLKKKYDDSDMKANMIKKYGKEKGESVYFATIRKQAMNESVGQHTLAEKLADLLTNYPHEKKLMDEGWGMHESLYQALCDHYWNEGRIPREVMYGPSERLRSHVEECYMEDTQPVMENPLVGAAVRGIVSAAPTIGRVANIASTASNLAGALASRGGGGGGSYTSSSYQDAVNPNQAKTLENKNMKKSEQMGEGLTEMDSEGYKGTRDDEEDDKGKKQIHLGPKHIMKAKDMKKDAEKVLNKSMDKAHKDQNVDEGMFDTIKKKAGDIEDKIKGNFRDKRYDTNMDRVKNFVGGIEDKIKGNFRDKPNDTNMDRIKKFGGAVLSKLGKKEIKDAQMESWEAQLHSLLNEGVTITTSTGNQGSPDNVSINASDEDAHELMKLIQNSGLGKGPSQAMSAPAQDGAAVVVEPVSQDEVMSTLQPDDDGEEAFGFIKRMLGARGGDEQADHGHGEEEHAHGDYEQEGGEEVCPECGHEECQCDDHGDEHDEKVDEDNYEMTQHASSDHTMSPLSKAGTNEELSGGQKKLDKAPPFGKLTGADFAALRKDKEVDENALGGVAPGAAIGGMGGAVTSKPTPSTSSTTAGFEESRDDKEMEEGVIGGALGALGGYELMGTPGIGIGYQLGSKAGDAISDLASGNDDNNTKMEGEWDGTGAADMAGAIAQNGDGAEDAETEKETAMSEGEETCNECGMMESHCGCPHDDEGPGATGEKYGINEWANTPQGKAEDEMLADMVYMTKSISGGLNNMKQDQTVVPSARVKTEKERYDTGISMGALLQKLQNIN